MLTRTDETRATTHHLLAFWENVGRGERGMSVGSRLVRFVSTEETGDEIEQHHLKRNGL